MLDLEERRRFNLGLSEFEVMIEMQPGPFLSHSQCQNSVKTISGVYQKTKAERDDGL